VTGSTGIAVDVETAMADAASAAPGLAVSLPGVRAAWLRAIADRLDTDAEFLVALAARESRLTIPRLSGELVRTTFQLRLFAQTVEDGSYLAATVDHADPDWPMGARPDLRRLLRPLGPAAVYAASNFPFAFSVAGGDTAAALAAGAPVVVKAHPAHPELSRAVAERVQASLEESGAPQGTFALIEGREAGRALVLDPRLTVATFTGSLTGGRVLFDLAASRPVPIPFYGELGSVNPVFVTAAAAAARPQQIAEGFAASMTLGVGQFCTKPGVILVPERSSLPQLVVDAIRATAGGPMLSDAIREGYYGSLDPLAARPDVELLVGSDEHLEQPTPTLYGTDVATFLEHTEELLEEHFGPAALLVRYGADAELIAVARRLHGQLTATIHGEDDDRPGELVELLAAKAGRVLWNGWPTGVSVTYAQQHGGPYPATTAPHFTSVGTASIARFLRPVAFQDTPDHLLPTALQEANPLGIPRRVDGIAVPGLLRSGGQPA
jgi:NADP-dependent aldehyde dehydrogenase